MAPDQPPLPTPRNFLFQSAAGIQTSILMSESADGVSVAATRQNAGRLANGVALAGGAAFAPGGVNCPAATSCADAIVVFGSASFARASHARPSAAARVEIAAASAMVESTVDIRMIILRRLVPRSRACAGA